MAPSGRLPVSGLHAAFGVAERWLAESREAINAVNVYPVPDGDTGTNMLLTLRAALEHAEPAVEDTPSAYGAALARGALYGARGNSGVILSQMLRGFAETLPADGDVDCAVVVSALRGAAEAAYASIPDPVEGTMLTVMREAAAAVAGVDRGEAAALPATLWEAADAADRSVARTPLLLDRLRDAGVVDAGGLGVAAILRGLAHGVAGTPLPPQPPAPASRVDLQAVEHEGHGYCTEFVLDGEGLDREAVRRDLDALGASSVLVVGNERTLHVHAHLDDPGPVLSAGAAAGRLSGVKIEDMQAQHDAWTAEREREALPALGLVAVVRGEGFARAFRDLGATQVVQGRDRPSAGELLEACRRAGRERVLLLPNDPDVLPAARHAAAESGGLIVVVPSRSPAAGLAAAVAFMPDGDPDALAEEMEAAAADVRCVEVTSAVRDATVDGVGVREGDVIAFLDGRLVVRRDDLDRALLDALAHAIAEGAELVTVYLGHDADPEAAARLPAAIAELHPGVEIEVLSGGQPHYPYIAAVE